MQEKNGEGGARLGARDSDPSKAPAAQLRRTKGVIAGCAARRASASARAAPPARPRPADCNPSPTRALGPPRTAAATRRQGRRVVREHRRARTPKRTFDCARWCAPTRAPRESAAAHDPRAAATTRRQDRRAVRKRRCARMAWAPSDRARWYARPRAPRGSAVTRDRRSRARPGSGRRAAA